MNIGRSYNKLTGKASTPYNWVNTPYRKVSTPRNLVREQIENEKRKQMNETMHSFSIFCITAALLFALVITAASVIGNVKLSREIDDLKLGIAQKNAELQSSALNFQDVTDRSVIIKRAQDLGMTIDDGAGKTVYITSRDTNVQTANANAN